VIDPVPSLLMSRHRILLYSPEISLELINEWLRSGEEEAHRLADEALKEMKESLEKHKKI